MPAASIAQQQTGQQQSPGDPDQIVNYRQMVNQSRETHLEAIRQILDGKVNFMHHVREHAVALSAMSRVTLEMYPESTHPDEVETAALPAIWENWSQFQEAAVGFNEAATQLVAMFGAAGKGELKAQVKRVEQSCETCHNTFMKTE
jgi:cytochrome c556